MDYNINDGLGLISKAMGGEEQYSIYIYPNPNQGIFTVDVQIPASETIIQTVITNIQTQDSRNVNLNKQRSFNVNMSDRPNGIYVLKVITNQKTITENFIKSN